MKKIVLVSDNHSDMEVLRKIYEANQDADYFLHCGDSEKKPADLLPFISIRGNNDTGYDFPLELIYEIEDHRILMLHGHRHLTLTSNDNLIYKALQDEVDLCFYGHTHIYADYETKGIRFVNPGSCWWNRDGSEPSFAIVYLDGPNIKVEKKVISEVM